MKTVFMKTRAFFVLIAVGILMAQSAHAAPAASVKEIKGEVFVRPAGSAADQWKPVSAETLVNNGDSVKTGNGSCVLSYGAQADFNLEANTSITVNQKTESQDINLILGRLRGKINSAKTVQPFRVVTPVAVGSVRGTEVDFDFNDQGLTVDLHKDGPVQVSNDEAGMELTLTNGNKITVQYNKEKGELSISNSCGSGGAVSFSFLGNTYSVDQCKSQTVKVAETAAGPTDPPGTNQGNQGNENNPNENQPTDNPPADSSPTTPSTT